MPQFTDALVNAGRMVPLVATAMLEGISMSCLWWKSGSTTGGAARSTADTPRARVSRTSGSAGTSTLSKTRGA